MSVTFNQNAMCKMLVSGSCEIGTNGNAQSVIYYEELEDKDTYDIPVSEIADWSQSVDEDGYLYMRFYTTKSGGGKITMSTTAPDEEDPAPIVYPAASISVVCNGEPTAEGQKYTVRVAVDQGLNLYSGPADNIASRTPIETWNQTSSQTHNLTLKTGVYTLVGKSESIQIEVK